MARERTCVACRQTDSDEALVRLVASPEGETVVDLRARLPGRGAWVHPTAACVARVSQRPGSLSRPLRAKVSSDGLQSLLIEAIERAVLDGLSMAAAAGALVGGHDVLSRELEGRRIAGVVVANDASERTLESLRQVAADDVPFVIIPLSRVELGHRVGRGERAALGVTPSRAASHLRLQLRRLRQLR